MLPAGRGAEADPRGALGPHRVRSRHHGGHLRGHRRATADHHVQGADRTQETGMSPRRLHERCVGSCGVFCQVVK